MTLRGQIEEENQEDDLFADALERATVGYFEGEYPDRVWVIAPGRVVSIYSEDKELGQLGQSGQFPEIPKCSERCSPIC